MHLLSIHYEFNVINASQQLTLRYEITEKSCFPSKFSLIHRTAIHSTIYPSRNNIGAICQRMHQIVGNKTAAVKRVRLRRLFLTTKTCC